MILFPLIPSSLFTAHDQITQQDVLHDIRLKKGWQLADTNHYARLRTVRDTDGRFSKPEIKVAYPGPLSNPNARYSPAEKLAE